MEIIEKYFPSFSNSQKQQYQQLEELYNAWNQKINVISRKDIDELYLRHVLHSLAIARYVRFAPGTHILDVGTGGGFPGIPLAICFPDAEFLLVDSIAKKIRVVQAICGDLHLTNCKTMCIRAENVGRRFDFIVSRAVAALPEFISWTKSLVSKQSINSIPNGILALKGGDLKEELSIDYKTKVVDLNRYFDEPFFETKKLVHVMM
jgi:16S rRNA (guanine527-N7)-methyltransferase